MNTSKIRIVRFQNMLSGFSDAFVLLPNTDYQAMISHSTQELSTKAWERTGRQMHVALQTTEKRLADVKRELAEAR